MGLETVVLGATGALLAALGVAISRARRREKRPVRARLDERGLHPDLSAGLTAVMGGQSESAIAHFRAVVEEDTDAVEVYVLLGDLYRQIGQTERALRIHRSVLNRSGLTKPQRRAALASMASDYEAAGFLDRALQAFSEVSAQEPKAVEPLRHLRRLLERSREWEAARGVQERIVRLSDRVRADQAVLAFLHDRVGAAAMSRGDSKAARKCFAKAIAVDPRCAPAHVHLGDLHHSEGRILEARRAWLRLLEEDPARGWLVFDRLDAIHRDPTAAETLLSLLRELAAKHPGDWRARTFLATRLAAAGQVDSARTFLQEAVKLAPAAPAVQRAAWRIAAEHGVSAAEARRMAEALGAEGTDQEPHACLRCRYRTAEPEWRCPHCHRWGTMAPESH